MKLLTGFLLLIVITRTGTAQYYYKDLVSTRQNTAQCQAYKANKVREVKLLSFERDGQPTEGFEGTQEVASDFSRITTHTRANGTAESWIIAHYSPQGLPTRITDTSDTYRSTSEYQYDPEGHILSITNTSLETDNHMTDVEQHVWQYDPAHPGRPTGMWKIKNSHDTTFIRFVADEKGNITEEHATRNRSELPVIYYYYDTDNHLTDIVRYSLKAQRLLPDNIFEYGGAGDRPVSMLVVPDGSNDYMKWIYEYNDKGLKTKESCFSRRKELLGRIEYQYTLK